MALIHKDQKQTCHRKSDPILLPASSLHSSRPLYAVFYGLFEQTRSFGREFTCKSFSGRYFLRRITFRKFPSGIWNDESGLMEFTFSEDGSLSIKPLLGPAFSGNYSLKKGDRLLLSYSTPLGSSEGRIFLLSHGRWHPIHWQRPIYTAIGPLYSSGYLNPLFTLHINAVRRPVSFFKGYGPFSTTKICLLNRKKLRQNGLLACIV